PKQPQLNVAMRPGGGTLAGSVQLPLKRNREGSMQLCISPSNPLSTLLRLLQARLLDVEYLFMDEPLSRHFALQERVPPMGGAVHVELPCLPGTMVKIKGMQLNVLKV